MLAPMRGSPELTCDHVPPADQGCERGLYRRLGYGPPPRQVRGQIKPPKADGIYRAALRGASTHNRDRAEAVARELAAGQVKTEPGKNRLLQTRREVVRGWNEVADSLVMQGQVELALAVRRFVARMPPPRTESEQVAEKEREAAQVRAHQEMSR